MVTINLLAWREYARIYEYKSLKKTLLVAIGATLLCVLSWHGIAVREENLLQKSNAKLRFAMDSLMRLQAIPVQNTNGINTAEKWLNYRTNSKKLWYELGKKLPNGICFTKIKRTDQTIFFRGQAPSATSFTDFLAHWHAATLFSEMRIEEIKQQANHGVEFHFQAEILAEENKGK